MARTIVGEAYIQILPTDGGVAAGTQKIINDLPKSVNVPVSADVTQAAKNVDSLAAQITGQIGGAWEQAAIQAATFTAAVLGTRAAIEGTVNKLAGLMDQLAQAQAGFTAILGSENAGSQLLDDIREFARVSPFVTQELVNYSQQLLGVGQSAESIVPLLKSTGDLIASVGGDTQNISRVLFTLTQIRSIGRLVGQDAIQLQSSLVPITKLLADFLGKTTAEVKKLQEQGAISADTVFAAITAAGSKVEGAMNNATRNISGARAVLSDTIGILIQDSEAVNKIFPDIVQGILDFSNALGENENLQRDIAAIDRSLASLYETLQPLFEGLSDTSSKLALSSLDILASSLEVLAAAIDAVPASALRLLGQALAVFAALKAPLFLIQYVKSIGELAKVIQPANAKKLVDHALGIRAIGNESEKSEPKLARFTSAVDKHVTAISALAVGAGLFINALGKENDALNTLGDTLTGAGFGAQLGAAFGPGGATAGLAAGAGIGFVTSFITNAREEAARRQEEMKEIGQRSARKFLEGFTASTGPIDSTQDFEKFFGDIRPLQDQLKETNDQLDDLLAKRDAMLSEGQDFVNDPSGGVVFQVETDEQRRQREEIGKQIDRLKDKATAAKEQLDSLFTEGEFADSTAALSSKVAQLTKDSEGFVTSMTEFADTRFPDPAGLFDLGDVFSRTEARAVLLGDAVIDSAEDLELFNDAARHFGLSLDEFISLPLETLADITSNKVPSALSQTRIEIQRLATAMDEAKKATTEFFKPFGDQINAAQAGLQASQGLTKAFDAYIADRTDANVLALGEAYLKMAENIATVNETAFKGSGTEAGVSFLIAQLDSLREQLGLTQPAFEDLLRSMGLLSLYKTGIDPGFTGSLTDLATQLGASEDALKNIIPSLNELKDGQQITINSNILEKINELSTLTDGFTDFSTVGQQTIISFQEAFDNIDLLRGLAPQLDELKRQLKATVTEIDIETRRALNPGFETRLQDQRNAEAIRQDKERKRLEDLANKAKEEAEREADRLRREAETRQREQERLATEAQRAIEEQIREQERLREAMKSASEAIEQSMERAADDISQAARQMTTNLRERVQDDQAVSVTRLIRNAQDQANRVQELGQGLEALRSRGLSSTTIQELGIDNITDIRQLRRLLSASAGDLAQLNSLVSLRDSNAEAIARRERQQETQATIVAAIIQAAGILGFEITPERAAAIAMNINITGDASSALLPTGIIEQIQNAGVLLRT